MMRAVAQDRFGGEDTLQVQTLPLPEVGEDDVLIRVSYAAVGQWDPFEREGGYAQMLGLSPSFPYVLGSEGAGAVERVGAKVTHLRPGDPVWAVGFLNPKGGFYAEFVSVPAHGVRPLPSGMSIEEAAGLGGVGLTALRGLEDTLRVKRGESVLILGASGGVGHLAVQLARRIGARVLAVASGEDGISLAKRLGAEAAVDGRTVDVASAARAFAPSGLDAALLTTGGAAAGAALSALGPEGRAAAPNGVAPLPEHPALVGYNGEPDADILDRLQRLATQEGGLHVHVDRVFPLEEAAATHRAQVGHHLGKLILRVRA